MDYKSSALVPALYLVLAIAVVGVVCVAFVFYRPEPGRRVTEQLADQTPADDPRLTPPVSNASDGSYVKESYAKAVQRNLYLEQLLDKRTRLLEKKSALLDRREAEYRELKQELDNYVTLLDQLSSTSTDDKPAAEAVTEPVPNENEKAAQDQLEQLRTKLAETKAIEQQLESELKAVKKKLTTAYAQMAEQQLASLVVQQNVQDTAVADASAKILATTGAEAIPAVVELLSDRRATVRVWAADVLGQMGRVAEDTVPRLREALMDPDPRVRAAAERSIGIILD